MQNETFNMLKANGYNLEHNFGHGKHPLASVLLTLNLLAFAFHTAVAACDAIYCFFVHLRTIIADVVFQDWPHLPHATAAAAIRPP